TIRRYAGVFVAEADSAQYADLVWHTEQLACDVRIAAERALRTTRDAMRSHREHQRLQIDADIDRDLDAEALVHAHEHHVWCVEQLEVAAGGALPSEAVISRDAHLGV